MSLHKVFYHSFLTQSRLSSNGLSAYMHEIGDSRRLNRLVQSDWLGLDGMTLGGRYGTRIKKIC